MLILVTGQKDSGKTTLCQRLFELARAAGWDVAGVLSPPHLREGHKLGIETVEQIKDWILSALEVYPPEKVYVGPDCGLKTRTPEEAEDKLRAMVRAVNEIKADMGWQ